MKSFWSALTSSLGKKYLMALSGLVLVGFVLGHMLGNLQVFLDPYYINTYGYKLQHLPYGLLWIVRLFLLLAVVVHVVVAIALIKENRAARPRRYEADDTVQASYASRTMWLSGPILLFFILFHLAHYTVRVVPHHEYNQAIVMADGTQLPEAVHLVHDHEKKVDAYGEPIVAHNVHGMMIAGFSYWYISALYIISMALLCMHLTHGVSSLFQTLGWRNETWRPRLNCLAQAYGWIVFLGFISIPLAVLSGIRNTDPAIYSIPAEVSLEADHSTGPAFAEVEVAP